MSYSEMWILGSLLEPKRTFIWTDFIIRKGFFFSNVFRREISFMPSGIVDRNTEVIQVTLTEALSSFP